MIEDFIAAELVIWALMITLLPVAAAIGLALVKYQADDEVHGRLRSRARTTARKPHALRVLDHSRRAANLKDRQPA